MSWLPSPYTLGVRRYVPGAKDARGNPVDAWADPIDLPVSGIAPGAMQEPGLPLRDASEVAFTVYLPAHENMPTERDLVTYGGVDYPVNGRPKDWGQGPFGFTAGWTFELRNPEG